MYVTQQKLTSICCCLLLVVQTQAQPQTYTNRIGIEFVLIQPGSLVVGRFQPTYPNPPVLADTLEKKAEAAPWTQKEYQLAAALATQDARPGFTAQIKRPYYIGKFELTQGQWKQVMGSNPSGFQGDNVTDNADLHPVERVTWPNTQQFLAKLNALDKSHHYRLPTEFEWEYAARAGANDDIRLETNLGNGANGR